MRERLMTLAGALVALVIVYALFFARGESGWQPSRPVTPESAPNGLRALAEWLRTEGVATWSLRERYPALSGPDAVPPPTGNVMLTVMPFFRPVRDAELPALRQWVDDGNTLLVLAALDDSPDWSEAVPSPFLENLYAITGLEFHSVPVRNKGDGAAPFFDDSGEPQAYSITPRKGHPLMQGVDRLEAVSDFGSDAWLPQPAEGELLLELATMEQSDTAMIWQKLSGRGHMIVVGSGTLLSNRAISRADNRRFVANVLGSHLGPGGMLVFDDMHQGLSVLYDPDAFYGDKRLHATLWFVIGFWLLYIAGSSNRLYDPAPRVPVPRQAEFLEATGAFISRHTRRDEAGRWLYRGWFNDLRRRLELPQNGKPVWSELERLVVLDPRLVAAMRRQYEALCAGRRISPVTVHNTIHRANREIG